MEQLYTAQDKQGRTMLHVAAMCNSANVAKRLLEAGAEANARDIDGNTPLHLAVEARAVAVFKRLLHHSATDVNARRNDDKTPLLLASFCYEEQLMLDLINAGADVNATEKGRSNQMLHSAIIEHQWNLVEALLQNGTNVNAQDEDGRTPLHSSSEDITRKLLDAGADVNLQDYAGVTPLHECVLEQIPELFQMLLHHGANVNISMHDGRTPLITAVHFGNETIIHDLINAGADVNAADNDQMTALHWAADLFNLCNESALTTKRVNAIRRLLDAGADPNARDIYGRTPLHTAIKTKSWAVFRILLLHRATNVNARQVCDGKTPLMMMILESDVDLEDFEELIKVGADLHATDHEGKTALHYTAKFDMDGKMNLLLKHGADVNVVDDTGMTALHTAIEVEAWAAFLVLARHKATDVNARHVYNGKTPLMMTILASDVELQDFEELIKVGADVHATDHEGKTALHYAAKFDKIDLLYVALEVGAHVDVQDGTGQTPLFLAASENRFEACRVLLTDYFADRYITDKRGKLPRDIASEMGHERIVRLLNEFMPAG